MYRVEDVVRYFLSKAEMSPKKLQKLLYYAYGWTLALLNESADDIQNRLFSDKFKAWIHGPVIPYIYAKYKEYGWQLIPMVDDFDETVFSPDVLDILNQVWDVYGSYTGNDLETISHREEPWIKARGNTPAYEACSNELSDKDIFDYFNSQAAS